MQRCSICITFHNPTITSPIDVEKTTAWGESGFPARLLGGFPPQSRTQYPAIRGVRPTTRGVHGAPPARRNAPSVHVHGNPKYRKPWAVRISPRERRPAPAPSSGKSRLSPRNAARAKSHQACRQSQQLNVRPALAENGANAASPSRNPWTGGAIPKGLPLNQHG